MIIPQNSVNLQNYFPGEGVNSSMTVAMSYPFLVSFQKKWAKEIAFFFHSLFHQKTTDFPQSGA